jgi:hypothetical protein
MERNFERIASGSDAKAVKEFTTERVKENETYAARWQNTTNLEFEAKVKEWGITSKLDRALIMRYGEGRCTIASLQIDSPKNWEKIVDAANWFRDRFDEHLGTVNSVRETYGYKAIAKRADYFRHAQEMTLAEKIHGFLFGGREVPTSIAGIVDKTRPGKPFTPVEMKRLGGEFTEDAFVSYRNYLQVVRNQIFHTDSVQRMRAIENYVRMQVEAGDQIDLSNVMVNMRDYTDQLAGQTIRFDKGVEEFMGPTAWRWYRFLQRQTASNMVGYNVKTAAYNLIPLMTQAPADMGKIYWLKGLRHSTMTPFQKNTFEIDGRESDFFTRRYPERRMALNFWEKGVDMGQALALAVDQFSVKAIISGKYFELKESGIAPEQAMKDAGDYAARMVADRSHGQLPVAMESKALRVFTLFQTEVQNQFSWMIQDIPQKYKGDFKKTFSVLTQYAVYSWVFNNISEDVTGTRPLLDPLYSLITLFKGNKSGRNRELGDRVENATSDLVQQLPFGNLNPLSGKETGRYPVTAGFPDPRKIRQHPIKESVKPLMYLFSPFGGGQAKKTIEGLSEFARGVSESPSGMERYGIRKDARNFFQGGLFGKTAFPEAVRYWSQPKDDR